SDWTTGAPCWSFSALLLTTFLSLTCEPAGQTVLSLASALPPQLLSLVAFVLEELVSSCGNCNPLYFFEFVSCTAFLFTLLLLILLSTRLHEKVGIECWPKLNFFYTLGIAVLLLISSIVFAADNAGSSLESAAEVFGFLATLIFALDVAYFLKTRGSPFKAGPGPGVSNGGPVPAAAPETERLNDQA
uniref:MARVEL domain-containing protein n=1 Tax=Oryzias sinensis TaxID=183150 RepID=A0A8C7WSN8_9TELE